MQSDAAEEYAEKRPEVIGLEALCLDAARPEMAGMTGNLSGDMEEGNFRAIWRGDRAPLTLREICRLRLDESPEARRATDALLSVLLNAGRDGSVISMDKVLALLSTSAACVDSLVRKLADGAIDQEEAADVLPAMRVLAARVVQMVASLETTAQKEER